MGSAGFLTPTQRDNNQRGVKPIALASCVMTFKHLKASEAAAILTKRCDELGADTYGSIAALKSSVVITEKLSVIRKLIQLKREIDRPSK